MGNNSLKTKKYYLCGGEMAERSNAAVLKTVDLYTRIRGFESLFLRQMKNLPMQVGIFVFRWPNQACLNEDR